MNVIKELETILPHMKTPTVSYAKEQLEKVIQKLKQKPHPSGPNDYFWYRKDLLSRLVEDELDITDLEPRIFCGLHKSFTCECVSFPSADMIGISDAFKGQPKGICELWDEYYDG